MPGGGGWGHVQEAMEFSVILQRCSCWVFGKKKYSIVIHYTDISTYFTCTFLVNSKIFFLGGKAFDPYALYEQWWMGGGGRHRRWAFLFFIGIHCTLESSNKCNIIFFDERRKLTQRQVVNSEYD